MNIRKLSLITGLALATTTALGAETPDLPDAMSKASYGIGANLGKGLRRDQVAVSVDLIIQGFKDAYDGKDLPMTDEEIRTTLQAYWKETREALGTKNLAEGKAFLEANKDKPGVITLPSGLQYKVIEEGKGNSPTAADIASVHYRGTLLNGTQFDSSYDRGAPAEFRPTQVIKGWSEALQLMKAGSKWQLFIPSDLAYGPNGQRTIPPNATLLFEVELLSFRTPEPPPAIPATSQNAAAPGAQQVVTSDIIRVPSKEEMEKGAKIEVIKKDEVDKYVGEKKAE